MNRYNGILSVGDLISRVNLDICVCEDNLQHQNEVLKDALSQMYEISLVLKDTLDHMPSTHWMETEADADCCCPKCEECFNTSVYVGDYFPLDLEIHELQRLV